jgi:hypothetical protein
MTTIEIERLRLTWKNCADLRREFNTFTEFLNYWLVKLNIEVLGEKENF